MSNFFTSLFSSQKNKHLSDTIKAVLFGVAVGDALGVPVEFKSREKIAKNPIKGMTGMGTYFMPPGTWSDDSSLTFCLAEALTKDFDLHVMAQNFVKWYRQAFWTATGEVFDIGFSTRQAILQIEKGVDPVLAGSTDVSSNGNGALMRILPLLFYIHEFPLEMRFHWTKQVSSVTHGHIRSVMACFYYLEFAKHLYEGKDTFESYALLQVEIPKQFENFKIPPSEIALFHRLLNADISTLKADEIQSNGYVLHTLEASIWCLLTTESYKEAVLKAVNLGDDTDTTGAVTGGLAGLLYGFQDIPKDWIDELAGREAIENLAKRVYRELR